MMALLTQVDIQSELSEPHTSSMRVCRAKAVECIGLYAMAGAYNSSLVASAVQLLRPLLVADSCCVTKQASVTALADLALLLGPAAIDAVLRSSGAHGAALDGVEEAQQQSGAGVDAAGGGYPAKLARSLLELLLEQAQVLLAEAQAPAVKPKRGRWVCWSVTHGQLSVWHNAPLHTERICTL